MSSEIDDAIRDIIAVAAQLVRGDGLPCEEDEKNGNRRVAVRMMRSEAIRRGNRLKAAVDTIRKAIEEVNRG